MALGANIGQTDGNFTRRIFIKIEWNWYVIFLELIIPVVLKIHGLFTLQSPTLEATLTNANPTAAVS